MSLLSRLTLLASSLAFLLAAMPVSAQETAAPLRAIYDEGCWTLQGYASASVGDEAGEVYQVRIGGERHWAHGMALEISGVVGVFDGDDDLVKTEGDDDGELAGVDVIFRWYFHRKENWALYTDAGLGVVWFSHEFPAAGGTSCNFEPQIGMGFTHRVGSKMWFFAGARWQHISNNNMIGDDDEKNVGYDGAMPYFGFSWLLQPKT